MSPSVSLQDAWHKQATWSKTAGELKAEIARSRMRVLALVIATAALTTLAAQFTPAQGKAATAWRVVAGAGGACSALAAILQGRSKEQDRTAKWTRARSASEALKEEVYRYATRSGDHATGDADAILRARVAKIMSQVGDIDPVDSQPEPNRRMVWAVRST